MSASGGQQQEQPSAVSAAEGTDSDTTKISWKDVPSGVHELRRYYPTDHPLRYAAPNLFFCNQLNDCGEDAEVICPKCNIGKLQSRGVSGLGARMITGIGSQSLLLCTRVSCNHDGCGYQSTSNSSALVDTWQKKGILTEGYSQYQDEQTSILSAELEAINGRVPFHKLAQICDWVRDAKWLEQSNAFAKAGGDVSIFPANDELTATLTAPTLRAAYLDSFERREQEVARCLAGELRGTRSVRLDHMYAGEHIFLTVFNERNKCIGALMPVDSTLPPILSHLRELVSQFPELAEAVQRVWTDNPPETPGAASRYKDVFPLAEENLDGFHFLQGIGKMMRPRHPALEMAFSCYGRQFVLAIPRDRAN